MIVLGMVGVGLLGLCLCLKRRREKGERESRLRVVCLVKEYGVVGQEMDVGGIDPPTSRMRSGRSTI